MKSLFLYILVVGTLGACNLVYGQAGNQYNINVYNGLPSNHVYNVLKDRYGYLWIATDKGVLRYNGYSFRLFNLGEGLPNADIWSLIEDKQGKIWLGCISDEIGYIYKDKYTKASFNNNYHTLYPFDISLYKNDIIFSTPYVNGPLRTVCFVENNKVYTDSNNYTDAENFYITPDYPVLLTSKAIYKGSILNHKIHYSFQSSIQNRHWQRKSAYEKKITINNFLVTYRKGDSSFEAMNLKNGTSAYFKLPLYKGKPDLLNYIYYRTDKTRSTLAYAFTNNCIYKYKIDDASYAPHKYEIDSLIPSAGGDLSAIYEDEYWNAVTTIQKGVYINYGTEPGFVKQANYQLSNYKCVGDVSNETSYWWNASSESLVKVSKDKMQEVSKNELHDVFGIVPINKDTAFLMSSENVANFWLILKKDRLVPAHLYDNYREVMGAIFYKPDHVFIMERSGFSELKRMGNRIVKHLFDIDRYRGITYDTLRKAVWAYNYNKIYIHNIEGKDTIITQQQFKDLGIKRLEKVVMDGLGNIFLKDYDKLVLYDPGTGIHKEVLKSYNLSEASIYLYGNIIVIAGSFGVVFNKIDGFQKMCNPFLYQNIKNSYYDYITSGCLNNKGLLIATNKGAYQIPFPVDSEMSKGNDSLKLRKYKLLVKYNGDIYTIKNKDTIYIQPRDKIVQFDAINPFGNGALAFTCKLADGAWQMMSGNEINTYQLVPDTYVSLSLVANDRVWRSDKTDIVLYVVPYWWQTTGGRRNIYLGIILFIIGLLGASIALTRRIIIIKHKRKNRESEIELRALYAQINPHFIFNTLGSAMLLIKQKRLDDAYTHVSRFSQLLRSYIHSSRNRYITVSDETDNLHAYIRLQQARFKNKFEYTIEIENPIIGTVKIPSLLVQPLVENAINHGLFHKEGTGHLYIGFSMHKGALICRIEDDGIGRLESKIINERSALKKISYGSKLIDDLIEIFNDYEGLSIEIKYADKVYPLTGTIVEIIINNVQYDG